jgi:hypothetical protein
MNSLKKEVLLKSGLFFARADSNTRHEGLYIKMVRKFDPWLDINKNQALGVWVKGDANGELLNIRIESPKHLSSGARGDHFIRIDFKGWKYFELVEIESAEFSNYIWPDSGFYVYDSFRHTVLFNKVDKIQLWYNNLPPGTDVKCVIGTVKALPMVPISIIDPEIGIGSEILKFKVKIESGMYLEFKSSEDCKLYGPKGEFLQDVQIAGKIPVVKNGDNDITFKSQGTNSISTRVQVTMITAGNPIDL